MLMKERTHNSHLQIIVINLDVYNLEFFTTITRSGLLMLIVEEKNYKIIDTTVAAATETQLITVPIIISVITAGKKSQATGSQNLQKEFGNISFTAPKFLLVGCMQYIKN